MKHGGQFIINDEKKVRLKGYHSIELKDGWNLHYHEKLPVYWNAEKDVLLLGYVWQTVEGDLAPYAFIEKAKDEKEILLEEEKWSGRYVLIIEGRVYLDAGGILGVFYSKDGVSSDIKLLARTSQAMKREWEPDSVVNFFPGPLTPYGDIKRLLPSQVFNYRTDELSFRNLLPEYRPVFENEEDLIKACTKIYCDSLVNISGMFKDKKLMMALTGGMDSRLLFAMAQRAGIDFECFALEHANMEEEDLIFPQEVCKRVGRSFTYYRRDKSKKSKKRYADYLSHLGHMEREEDITFYEYGQYEILPKKYGDVVILRSSLYGIPMEIYRHFIDDDRFDMDKILNKYELRKGSLEAKSFKMCCDWIEEHPIQGLSRPNRFYWEERSGCWDSENEHGFDIYDDIISLQPMNNRRLIYLFLQFPEEKRIVRQQHADMIRYACPEIADIPFKVDRPSLKAKYIALKKDGKKFIRRLHRIGPKRTYTLYMNNIRKLRGSFLTRKRH